LKFRKVIKKLFVQVELMKMGIGLEFIQFHIDLWRRKMSLI